MEYAKGAEKLPLLKALLPIPGNLVDTFAVECETHHLFCFFQRLIDESSTHTQMCVKSSVTHQTRWVAGNVFSEYTQCTTGGSFQNKQ